MPDRLITPSQLALFSRSPVIGAWWEELHAQKLFQGERPATSSLDELLFASGLQHEQVLLDRLEAEGRSIARLPGRQLQEDYDATLASMRSGVEFIHQASLRNDEMRGSADLLERIERPSALGPWSYIPIECKLSSHPKPIYLVQACAYCELLEPILGHRPDHFRLYLGGGRFAEGDQGYPSERFWSWYEQLRQRYRAFRASFDPALEPEDAPGDHGLWEPFIQQRLEQNRDLILVANLRGSQRDKLRAAGITTIDDLATLPPEQAVPGLDKAMRQRLQEQAAIQIETPEGAKRPAYRVRSLEQQERGLALLPAPDPGDVWFDMEGFPDPISGEKLEYLFGACFRDEAGELRFKPWWAHTPAEEKQAFDGFIQWVQQRRERYPNLHVYHYASYEKTALGNLAARHQLHQGLWDQWLREELFVDLYPIVRRGLLLGAPSYSIKKVERLYADARNEEVESAADSVVQYAEWRKSGQSGKPGRVEGESALLQDLQDYNQRDCEVTEGLHSFLLQLPEMEQIPFRANRWAIATAGPGEAIAASEAANEKELEVAARTLLQELPESIDDAEATGPRGLSWRLQKLLAQLLDFHEREGKVEWWEYFNRLAMPPQDREEESEVIAGARLEAVEELTAQSNGYRYRFNASQPLKLAAREGAQLSFAVVPLGDGGSDQMPLATSDGFTVTFSARLDEDRSDQVTISLSHKRLAQLREAGLQGGDLPRQADLVPLPKQIYKRMLEHLVRQAQGWVFDRRALPPAFLHLLERRSIPALPSLNQRIRQAPESTAAELASFLLEADGIALSLQGPPGTGKTTVTADVIARLVASGQRVAVSSNSNEAINLLLRRVQGCLDAAGEQALVVKASSSTSLKGDEKALAGSAAQALAEKKLETLPQPPAVLGGTVFTLVKDQYDNAPFDWLVIDEAGQVALSNLLFMSRVARNILLVGDQQQLSQPNRAAHPEDSGLSCLDYVMADHAVVPSDRGVFLATSWRMPPALTTVVSELFYEGQLQGADANQANRVLWHRQQQGLLFEPVAHQGNGTGSDEEVEAIAALVEQLLGKPYQRARQQGGAFMTEDGILGPRDILITAPYNLQVNRLKRRLGNRARIGTVDKFQGQEAPVAIHSLTASDGDAAPRGLAFLLDPNRLNVAISRAQCLSILVGSPQLASGISRSVQEVHQLSRLCRLLSLGCRSQ